jgi:hypothetical protein
MGIVVVTGLIKEEHLLKLLHVAAVTAAEVANGSTGNFSQSQISIINPSGSWKNSWSTMIPPSSTTRRVLLIFLSRRAFSTCTISSHCNIANGGGRGPQCLLDLSAISDLLEFRSPMINIQLSDLTILLLVRENAVPEKKCGHPGDLSPD